MTGRATAEVIAPLSSAQYGLWFLEQLDGPSDAYIQPFAHRLRGPLDVPALEHALTELVRRQRALRSRVDLVDGEPRQIVGPAGPARLHRLDLAHRPGDAAAEVSRFALRPFDLAAEDPLRTLLVRLGPDDHVLVCAVHHMFCDGLSLAVLGEELAVLYRAARSGRPPATALPPLAAQYAEVVAERAERAAGPRGRAALARWRERLAGAPALDLRTDLPRPPVRSGRGARVPLVVPAGDLRAVREAAGRHRVTPYMLLLAAFATTLRRAGRGTDLSVGTPVSGRSGPAEESLIGLFTNTVVLRLDLSGEPGPEVLLGRVRQQALAAYQDGHVPFEHVVDELRPARDLSRTPLFQVMFSFQEFDEHTLALDGLDGTLWDVPAGTSKFDLELELGREGDRLTGFLEYSTDLFTAAGAGRLAGDFLDRLRDLLRGAPPAPSPRSPAHLSPEEPA
ncbi:condensation domain-containing protein [Kitasatospora sp. NPDC056327]|uniref:condensation domain-containing protein n=1 Tax=Kitasatospora sp. NPDC056327 TaxID=3345785 RepID=UPI0035E2781A